MGSTVMAIVRPSLEYAAAVWDPTLQKRIQQLEQVQRRAARFVCNNYTDRIPGCVARMIQEVNWEPLQTRRRNIRLSMLHKIIHGKVDITRENYLQENDRRTRCSTRRGLSTKICAKDLSFATPAPWGLLALGDACVFLIKTSQLLNVIFQNFAGMFPSSSTIVCRYSRTDVLLYFHNVDGYFVASSIRPIQHTDTPLRFKMAAPNISEA